MSAHTASTLAAHAAILFLIAAGLLYGLRLTGQVILCMGGFAGIGAYSFALLTTRAEVPVWAAIMLASAIAALGGAAIGQLASRIHGSAFLMSLLALQVLYEQLLYPLRAWTGGTDGIQNVPGLGQGSIVAALAVASIALLVAFAALSVLERICLAPFGMLLRAYADDAGLLRQRGLSARVQLTWTYGLIAFLGGLAGALRVAADGLVFPGDGSNLMVAVNGALPVLIVSACLPHGRLSSLALAGVAAALVVAQYAINGLIIFAGSRWTELFWQLQFARDWLIGGLLLWCLVPTRRTSAPRPSVEPETSGAVDPEALNALVFGRTAPLSSSGPVVELEHVTVERHGVRILDPLSISLRPGQCVALTGPNGCGKTTALSVIVGAISPSAGRVRSDGTGIQLGSTAAYLGGSTLPFASLTPAESIAIALASRSERGLRAALASARWAAVKHRSETLLRSMGLGHVGRRAASSLSWGQGRRVALVSLLVQARWPLVALDEPSAGLDTSGRGVIETFVRGLRERLCTVTIAEHDRELVRRVATREVRFNDDSRDVAGTATIAVANADRRPGTVLITTRAMSAGYARRPVVYGADIEITTTSALLVEGPNGSGKTTLLRTLAGLLPPCSGELTSALTRGSGGLAFVGSTLLFERRTVTQNLERAERLANRRGALSLHGRISALLIPLRHRDVTTLSLGERRVVRLAMALAQRPRLLILDEPSLNLSTKMLDLVVDDIIDFVRQNSCGLVIADHHFGPWARIASGHVTIATDGFLIADAPRVAASGARLAP